MLADAVPDARARCLHGFIGQMRVPPSGLNLRVTEHLPIMGLLKNPDLRRDEHRITRRGLSGDPRHGSGMLGV